MKKQYKCPKEIDGKPIICVYEKDWQKEVANLLKKKQSFLLIGPEEYINKIYKEYISGNKKEVFRTMLIGSTALGVPSLGNLSNEKITIILAILFGGIAFGFLSGGLSIEVAIATVAVIVGISTAIVIVYIGLAIKRGDIKVKRVTISIGEKEIAALEIECE